MSVEICAICLEDETDVMEIAHDQHTFHVECLNEWRKTGNGATCPLCRAPIGLPGGPSPPGEPGTSGGPSPPDGPEVPWTIWVPRVSEWIAEGFPTWNPVVASEVEAQLEAMLPIGSNTATRRRTRPRTTPPTPIIATPTSLEHSFEQVLDLLEQISRIGASGRR